MASNAEFALPLLNKLAIVTGASRGIGAGIAWELARQGASVVLAYTSESSKPKVAELAQKIAALPHSPKTYTVKADLSTLTGPKQLVDDILSQAGNDLKVDILVNNAAVERVVSFHEATPEDYSAVFDLNVRGPILLMKALHPYFRAPSHIINLSSVAARHAFKEVALYAASKAALEGLTRCWAAEMGGDGTTVNAVAPGPVQSDMLDNIPGEIVEMQRRETPIQTRLGTVEEIAGVVAWLAGPTSGWVTGQVICASGGWEMY
ncbi:Short-chain dehydrogenase/reductase SDR [Pleurostoma richardsiae]|uniref:Short-chain dehydrogenase/reductase SDR n=1 Tax=Pleurostoma richardsiae TaxID=41990 RepID=A0AA38VUJ5_9PEZI|nr:Short-chain dehydrogenase/reductase SDR [Pleurostoma richardsiae]